MYTIAEVSELYNITDSELKVISEYMGKMPLNIIQTILGNDTLVANNIQFKSHIEDLKSDIINMEGYFPDDLSKEYEEVVIFYNKLTSNLNK